jgi:archaellum component FlaC
MEGKVMEHLLKELSENVKLSNQKMDEQVKSIAELNVKMDLYRETQGKHDSKIERLEETVTTQNTEISHLKIRLDKVDKIVWTVVVFIVLAVLGAVTKTVLI